MDPIAFEESKPTSSSEPNPHETPDKPVHNFTSLHDETKPSVFQTPTAEADPKLANVKEYPSVSHSKFSLLNSYAYIPEYAILLIVLLILVSAITTLIGIGIENLAGPAGPSDPYGYTAGIDTFLLTTSLASLIVTLPLAIVLFVRTKRSEAESPLTTQHRWRKGFLGAFLVLQTLAIVCNLFALAYDLLSRVINPGEMAEMFSGDPLPVWAPIVTTLLSVSLMGLVVFVMSADYRKQRG